MNPHHVLKKLLLTEDTYNLVQENSTVVFKVPKEVDKLQIRRAVEKAFQVRTVSVNTCIVPSKKRPIRGRFGDKGVKPSYKKAFVKVHPDDMVKLPLI